MVNPEDIILYPKGKRRKQAKGNRKRGRSVIATDMPAKNACEEKEKIKANKEKKNENTKNNKEKKAM